MAIDFHRAALNKRWLPWVPGLAALTCAAIMLYLIIEIDQTRQELQNDGVLEFNFVQQVDHNFDTFAQSLLKYTSAEGHDQQVELRQSYINQYDILYSSIRNVSNSWLGNLANLESTNQLFIDANAFLDQYEPYMHADKTLHDNLIVKINEEALALSADVYNIGLKMFQRKSVIRDNVARRMDDLYKALGIFGLFFFVASLLTIAFLVALSRKAANLSADARQTQSQLSTALDELTTGDMQRRAQNRFMASASHDLRQPLHALGLYLSALNRHVVSAQGKRILSNINRSTEALNQLLNSMLDLSKLDAGVVDVNPTNLSLDEIFDNLYQNFLPEATQRNLLLDVQFSELSVRTDKVLLERILGNLVGNALNYTQEGKVTLSAKSHENQVIVQVADTGPGIPVSEQEAVFNEYYQLSNSERDRTKGLGLGLSIVKRLTRLLDIRLGFDSSEGQGTRFEIVLEQANQPDVLDRRDTGRMPEELTGLSILVIDDEYDVRDGMRTLLTDHDCKVRIAESAESACKIISDDSWVPDLVIADYRLRNEQTGEDAIVRVRDEVNVDVPAMIITGDTSPARLRDAAASGFTLLHKPVVAEQLFDAITNLVEEHS